MVASKMAEILVEIFIVMAVGYYVAYIKLVKEEHFKMLADLTILVATPLLIFYSMYVNYTPELLKASYKLPLVSSFTVVLTLLISAFIFKLLKVPEEKKNALYALSSFSNTIFLGLPINMALYGDISLPYVILYDLGHTPLFWTLGIWVLSDDKSFDIKGLKQILNPSFISIVLSFMVASLRIHVPEVIMKSAHMIGSIAIPMALLFIGMNMYVIEKGDVNYFLFIPALIKLILTPLIAFLLVYYLNLPVIAKKVAVLEAAMPTMITVAIVARQMNEKNSFASTVVFIANLLSFLTIPIFLVLLNKL
ncbi:AEC family transporter [Caldanaerobacter sp.]|uniref:AEC family transporter n=1 Tax=Caldanaerobacter sp. TaxID=2930036 RepID=UPI003C784676